MGRQAGNKSVSGSPRGSTLAKQSSPGCGRQRGTASAARRSLTAPRLVPLWLTLERNRAYWSANATGPSTRRISFAGSQLVWQWFPGQGLQFHPQK